MRKILVTAIGGNVGNGILKVLQDTEDIIYGCDVYDYPTGMDKVSECWKSKFAVSDNYIEDLLYQCLKRGITHVIPVNESEILKISKEKGMFEEHNIKVVINKNEIIESFLDKKATYDCLKNIDGIEVPKTYVYNEFIEDGSEYIIKLRHSCGSKFLKRVHTKEEFDKLCLKEDDYVIQEYLKEEKEEYTIGVFSNGKRIETIAFRRKLEHGYTSFIKLIEDKHLKELGKKIANNIGLKGCINIQLRKDKDRYKIFEINPRISGTVYFRHMLGFQDVLWWLNFIDGNEEYQFENKYHRAIGLRELTEKFVVLE